MNSNPNGQAIETLGLEIIRECEKICWRLDDGYHVEKRIKVLDIVVCAKQEMNKGPVAHKQLKCWFLHFRFFNVFSHCFLFLLFFSVHDQFLI